MTQTGYHTYASWIQPEYSLCEQILIHPTDKQKMTVDQVNSNAPVYSVPGVRPRPFQAHVVIWLAANKIP